MDGSLGLLISEKRKQKQLTQAQLAAHFGISDKAVSKWERGLSKPDERFMPELVEFLGLSPEFLPAVATENKSTWFSQFEHAVKSEFFRILCVGTIIACGVCLATGCLSPGSALFAVSIAAGVLGLVTIIKSGA
ncbi:MAG: helix-turn-helix transcriptional regulator [Eubacteriales bacterium]|nr:helix-turn-helix transcriptional regulator [Eubacteriales bacterium]MDY4897490.1 helix-turn-helix transcriptional regulator [Eubacteriales bacterium]